MTDILHMYSGIKTKWGKKKRNHLASWRADLYSSVSHTWFSKHAQCSSLICYAGGEERIVFYKQSNSYKQAFQK